MILDSFERNYSQYSMNSLLQFFESFNFGGGGGGNTNASSARTNNNKASQCLDKSEMLAQRRRMIGSKCQTFYSKDPLIVSRAQMQYIFDETGKRFLDCISNVQHVGHCHPHVVERISTQLALSTCNIRFLSPILTECAQMLVGTLAPQLDTVLFCNSGSEANDLAMQLARDWSSHQDMIVLENAYHGHITTAVQMSPYKFQHGSNIRQPEWVHIAPAPDVYRGQHRLDDSDIRCPEKLHEAGRKYADEMRKLLEEIERNGRQVAAFIAEAFQSCGGQVIPPAGYFPAVSEAIHAHGGLVIIDEVQTGFGRVGQTFWAHQLIDKDFIPDIVTMGKSMGNGYPVAAVITRKEIADKLCGDAEYFNTYGGNPVSCAAVLGVLEVIRSERMLEHSQQMGDLFQTQLNTLKAKHHCIGDVRGVGMFWGVDLVTDRQSREPATDLASRLILKLRQESGILLNADGPHGNILKFKPPLCFGEADLTIAIKALDKALMELARN